MTLTENAAGISRQGKLSPLTLAALGIVFGDIGTSPLYTFQTILHMSRTPGANSILGALSLVLWTLFVITTIKYVSFAMRVDNDGEGGILALMALLGLKRQQRAAIVAAGLFGAALIYGDGAITPAISVLSALEGLNMVTSEVEAYIVPAAVAILVALFVVQSKGTAKIGQAFGPVMLVWFLAMAVLGVVGIAHHPRALVAVDPRYGISYLFSHGFHGFLVLGGVFLCVTGAEALYADMGHFGRGPIRLSWFAVVFPSLILNYAGQAALVLDGSPIDGNIFYRLCPPMLLIPLVVLATLATIIASQAIITGAFSMTRQAIQLGWLPRLNIRHTSSEGSGQIYIGVVNWLLMIATIGLTVMFGKSDNLAAAYGIAVSLTMLMTTVLLFIAMRDIWGWGPVGAGLVAAIFLIVDSAFVLANITKVAEGGYVPLLLALAVYALMWTWHRGAAAVAARMQATSMPLSEFLEKIQAQHIARVPGTAVFLTRMQRGTPPLMVWHVEHDRALHQKLVALRIAILQVPWVAEDDRLTVKNVAPDFWSIEARYGFMERMYIPDLLKAAQGRGCELDLGKVVFYVGHNRVLRAEGGSRLPAWQQALFTVMERNAAHVSEVFSLPSEQVVEIGRQISI
jgi:KUP system potassium uptake protein